MVGVVRSLLRFYPRHCSENNAHPSFPRKRESTPGAGPPMAPPRSGGTGVARCAPTDDRSVCYVLRLAGADGRIKGVADGDRACAVVDVAEGIAVGLDGLH